MSMPTAKELFDARVHVGHQLRRWNPKFRPFVYDHRQGISIIDLERTLEQLQKACQFAEHLVSGGQEIWFLGTKPQAREVVREAAEGVHMPFCVVRWLGGTLTNFSTINCGLQKYRQFLHMEEKGDIDRMPNKEAASLRRKMVRMRNNFEGLMDVEGPPAALYVVDANYEDIAVREANRMGIPVIAIVDSNSDPSRINFPIPGNDDSLRSVAVITSTLAGAISRGKEGRELRLASQTSSLIKRESIELAAEITLSADVSAVVDNMKENEEFASSQKLGD
ncbi:MAG: 30S ribosomal protein S2 [Puniceicoccales bacterium]|nr:30S ribosomal protein S2 [Puniceicoccales bacterium]